MVSATVRALPGSRDSTHPRLLAEPTSPYLHSLSARQPIGRPLPPNRADQSSRRATFGVPSMSVSALCLCGHGSIRFRVRSAIEALLRIVVESQEHRASKTAVRRELPARGHWPHDRLLRPPPEPRPPQSGGVDRPGDANPSTALSPALIESGFTGLVAGYILSVNARHPGRFATPAGLWAG